jgi:hypothetical protein
MSDISPEKVLELLKNQASSRIRKTLSAIFIICKEQQEKGLNEFSFSTIAKLGKGRGVPGAQSIRNTTGLSYRTLISSFSDQVEIQSNKQEINTPPKTYAWINEIKDPVIRLQANILYTQKKEAERLIREIVPINQVIEVFDGAVKATTSTKLTDLEREALEYLLSNEFFRRNRLEYGKSGSVVNCETKESIFPIATIDAITKALMNL